ncbi:MAG TPA: LLM class flavin-dependent oxidoreductase, partial [Acidimicrobiales bacterium]|nr:LLM class flavin-dependent oxidoreductase [Acidimicrobiales bacterium]
RLLEVAARHAVGWNTVWAWTEDAYRERLRVLEAACERAGRDPATLTRSLGLYALVGEDEADVRRRFDRLHRSTPRGVLDRVTLDDWRVGRLVGTVEQVREQAERWRSLGVAMLIVGLGAVPFTMTDSDDLDLVASALL